jgi:[acyl-carrier-protein] S-malonyltransferase
MGRDLADSFPVARRVFEEADDRLGLALSRLCFEGPEDALVLTEHAQPAILAASVAAFRVLEEIAGLRPAAVAGHSLGEWSALVAAGALALGDAVVAVRERGRLMQEAVPAGEGAMAALMGVERADVEQLCDEARGDDVLSPANLNGAGQIVVAGHTGAVERLLALAAARRIKAQRLPVSAPFHCALMKPAADRLAGELQHVAVADPKIPVVRNVDAGVTRSAGDVVPFLLSQVASPVRWTECVRQLAALGATAFVEVGPGRVLTALTRRIAEGAKAFSVEDPASLDKALAGVKA